ncbi:MAG TPA: hypothetical protein IAB61_11970 [Candidatus Merdisoma merdipullorum]|nr:hypothetical protein [Candidatus Merdisoma merdipullorum]
MRNMGTKARMGTAILLAVLITAVYFLFVYQNLPFIYDINDDVAMRNVAAGVITGKPDAHLIFVKYILGLCISGLYGIFPGWDWYGIVMIGIILLSFALILYRGLVMDRSALWKIVYVIVALLLFTCVGLWHITAFQWTVTAAFAGTAGVFLFYTSGTENRFQNLCEEGVSVFLLLLCLSVRNDVFMMVLPAAALCFWFKYGTFQWEKLRSGKFPFALRHWGILLALVIGVLGIIGLERFAYRSPQWQEFLSYNADRSVIMDYYGLKNYEDNQEFYDSLGLSPEETENIQRYSLYLCDDLYSDTMHSLAVNVQQEYFREHSVRERLVMGFQKVLEHLTSKTYAPLSYLSYLSVIAVLVLGWFLDKKQFALAFFINAVLAAMWMYLGFRGRIVERVCYGMFLLQFLSMLAVGWRILLGAFSRKREGSRQLSAGIMLVCAVLLILPARKEWQEVEGNVGWRSSYNEEFLDVNRYMAEHMENVYFMTTFSIETYTDNFTLSRDFAFTNLLSVGGWHTFSPLENEKCQKLGITDPKTDIVEKENVYVISLENVNLRYMDRYYTSVYGEEYLGRELTDALDYGERVFEVYDFSVRENESNRSE